MNNIISMNNNFNKLWLIKYLATMVTNSLNVISENFIEEYDNILNKNYELLVHHSLERIVDLNLTEESCELNRKTSYLEESILNAIDSYKEFHNNDSVPNFNEAKFFLQKIDSLFLIKKQDIVFKRDSLKVIINLYDKNLIIDYDYGYETSILVTEKKHNSLEIKECSIDNIEKVMRSYFELSDRVITAA